MKVECFCLCVLGSKRAKSRNWHARRVYSGCSFLEERRKGSGGVAAALQAVEKKVGEVFHVGTGRVLPEVSVQGPEDQSVEDTRGLCR